MPVNIPVGDGLAVYRHTITGDSEEMLVTVGIGFGTIATFEQATVDELFADYKAEMATTFSPSLTMVGVTLYLKAAGGFTIWDSTGASAVGTSSGTAAPPNVAVLAHKNTGQGGRRGRGRMFLPGVSEGFIDPNGALTSAAITQINSDLASWYSSIVGIATVDDVLLYHNNDLGNLSPTIVTGFTVDSKVATQRRRLR